jgi:hypothetical protein
MGPVNAAQETFASMMKDPVGPGLRALGFKGSVQKSYLPAKPSASILYGSLFWQKRIGKLLPAGEDKWWLVHAGHDAKVVGDEVLAAIRDFALPAMQDQIARMETEPGP